MAPIFAIPYMVLNVAWFFIIAHFIMSWLIAFNVLNLHQQVVGQIWQSLNRFLDPIYRPIRQYLPSMGGLADYCGLAIYFGLLRRLTH
jgi:YggT family protein